MSVNERETGVTIKLQGAEVVKVCMSLNTWDQPSNKQSVQER